jgi:undecaprenyl-diphosphatase
VAEARTGPGRRGWSAAAILAEAVRRFLRGWRDLPRDARRRWGWAFGGGFLAAQAAGVLAVLAGRRLVEPTPVPWESAVLAWLGTQPWLSFNAAVWLEPVGSALVLWPLMLLAAGAAAWRHRPLHALSLLLGYASVFLHVLTGWLLWPRARPTSVADGIASPGLLHSFPSGHVAQAVFAYGILVFLWCGRTRSTGERVLACLLLATLVGIVSLGRLRLGAHWPSDVAAALVVAGVWTAAVAFALRRGTGAIARA